jgi:hypothetical protein
MNWPTFAFATLMVPSFSSSFLAAGNAPAAPSPFARYDIAVYCRQEHDRGRAPSLTRCEDGEVAVRLILVRTWATLAREDSVQTDSCLALNSYFDEPSSYLVLLECITGVGNAAE